jgi:chromosome segregation ATPase
MHIEEIIIDGFKSYAKRTVVQGFDQQFNAITGLNGSGKSNILDSICFVLGISKLEQVRAGSLQVWDPAPGGAGRGRRRGHGLCGGAAGAFAKHARAPDRGGSPPPALRPSHPRAPPPPLSSYCVQELVYKQGQAGVTRASVTIVFNNKDKKGSPVGYESYDEIAVCRQVAIGGRNKYLINGHVAQQNKVQNLFHSVQLNVNNPHFLIMQGNTLSKVLYKVTF